MSSRGICQWVRNPAKIYPWCMCQQPAEADEKYCAEHKAERAAEVEKLMEARRRSAHIDGSPCPIQGPHDCDRSEHESR